MFLVCDLYVEFWRGCFIVVGRHSRFFANRIRKSRPSLHQLPLVLLGGTIIDVTDWGRSAIDQQNSIVIVQNGKITDVGSRLLITIPKGAQRYRLHGKVLVSRSD